MDTSPAPAGPARGGGRLVLAATPIGDPADASEHLRTLLSTADVVAAEDTRRAHALAARLGVRIAGRVLSVHEHNESARSAELLDAVAAGATVVLVSDAGMPSVSDPGYRLVLAAIDAGLRVATAPGPSAVLAALAVSGLATDRFCFEGFLPRRAGERATALAALADERRTMVFFEAPHRLAKTVAAMAVAFGDGRPAAVCRELTKTHEEVRRGTLAELAAWAESAQVRGEISVVVAGAAPAAVAVASLVPEVAARVDGGERLKEAVAAVAEATGASKRELYAATLAARSPA